MNKTVLIGITLLIIAPSLTGCETFQPRQGEIGVGGRSGHVRVIFSDSDRAYINEYYTRKYKGLPPGLAKKGKIPPGHAMQMQRDGLLPPGVSYNHLPSDLERRLSRLPEGYARIVVGGDIGIMDTRTRVVVDLIKGIAHDD